MKKLLLLLTAITACSFAQTIQQVTTDPGAGSNVNCVSAPTMQQNTTNGHISYCINGTGWVTLTPPTSASTIARTDAGQTFTGASAATGWTLVSPVITNPTSTGPVPIACGATCSATSGQLILMNAGTGSAVTIPAATGTGNTIRIRVSVATASAQDKVLLTTVTDTIIGTAIGENAGTAKVFVGNAGTYHSIQMPNAGSQPSGGFVGDAITCTDIASTVWACQIEYQAGTTPTTPYNTGTT